MKMMNIEIIPHFSRNIENWICLTQLFHLANQANSNFSQNSLNLQIYLLSIQIGNRKVWRNQLFISPQFILWNLGRMEKATRIISEINPTKIRSAIRFEMKKVVK